jgi:hypothetical protein
MQTNMKLVLLAALMLTMASTAASAQQRAGGNSACAADLEKFCAGVEPGAGRIYRCLEEHEAQLSDACKEHVAQMRQRAGTISAACKDDLTKFCKSISVGGGRVRNCLKRHEAELSPSCKTALEEAQKP